MAKNLPFFDFFDFCKNCSYDLNETFIFYTIVWSMCAISINSYNWDWSEGRKKASADSFTANAALVSCRRRNYMLRFFNILNEFVFCFRIFLFHKRFKYRPHTFHWINVWKMGWPLQKLYLVFGEKIFSLSRSMGCGAVLLKDPAIGSGARNKVAKLFAGLGTINCTSFDDFHV